MKRSRRAKRLQLVLLMGLTIPSSAFAADFSVTTSADSGAGSFRNAITGLNAAGVGTHSITFDNGLNPIALSSGLPMIIGTGQTVTIVGSGSTIDGQNTSRLFFIADGNVSIQNLTLQNGLADGGDGGDGAGGGGGGAGAGGGLFVNEGANVIIQGVTFSGNAAVGGNGGSATTGGGGGGGGGLGGNGGTVLNTSDSAGGAGGGGWDGDGGDVQAGKEGGGGGGGLIGSGGNATTPSGASGGGFNDGGDSSSSAADATDGSDGVTGEGGQGGGSRSDYIAGSGGDGGLFGGGGGGGMAEGDDVAPVSGGAGGSGGNYGGGGGGGGIESAEPTDSSGAGGNAGDFGGGGGGGASDGGLVAPSGDGGFMGGGAGAARNGSSGSSGGFGAGDGGEDGFGGQGGDALGGAIFVRSGGTLTIIDSDISGSGVTQGLAGAGTISGSAGNVGGAGMFLHNGVNTGISVSTSQSQTISDNISGDGGLTKSGDGTLILSGTNDYAGGTSVTAGTLKVNGSMDGILTIGTNGTLGGSGSITGDVINNGTLAVGNSIGTLAQTGNYTHNGGAFEVEIASGGNTPGVHNDVLNVTGNATINGGDVAVSSAAGTYTLGTQYTFLTATSLSGTFDSISDDLAFFDTELGYTANSAFFTLIENQADFASIAVTGNQASIAAYIDAIAGGATGDTADLIDQFTLMSHGQVQNGLNQLTGDIYGSGIQIGIQGTTHLLGMIAAQLRDGLSSGPAAGSSGSYGMLSKASSSDIQLVSYESSACDTPVAVTCRPAEQWRGWVLGYGLGGFATSDGNALGIDYGIGGTAFGAQRFIDQNTQIGFFGGYVGSNVTTRGADQSVTSDGGNLGGLFTHGSGDSYLLGIGGIEFNGIESNRDLVIGGLATRARGETDSWQGFTYGETGMNISLACHSMLQPFAGLQYIYSRQNEFTETGAGAANLVVAGIDTHSLRSNVGARWQLMTLLEKGYAITPELRGSWLHEFLDTSSIVNGQLAGAGGAGFAANGLDLGRDWAIVGGGISARPSNRWELRADYNSQFNDRTVMHVGSGSVAYVW